MIARARILTVVVVVLCGGLGVISSTQTWLTVTLSGVQAQALTVSGAAAVPVLAPLSLAVLALGGALSIVGTWLRIAFGALAVVIGLALGWLSGVVALTHPTSAVARTVTDATGITGARPVQAMVKAVHATPWPLLTVLICLVLVAVGVFVIVSARRWAQTGRRFRTDASHAAATAGPLDAVDSWDGLSRGEDPTGTGDPR